MITTTRLFFCKLPPPPPAIQARRMKTNGESLFQEAVSPTGVSKQKNLKITMRPMRLGLWNTKTLCKTENKIFLVGEMDKYNIDVCGICEMG